ncbi:hypothetical protein HELRODRAFT_162141 [Helobdella robusta]|uniref:Uncharacterized protein n=1 Tax=Helobdella robusta TaxID=6412 RepID=T1ESA1_HELRO|nr:hypothetical protein HELRODRAFT_162141 [Helobdella robusta]ESN98687.1 hypothetical protein HELRODRAFT_162141 [Helobdella robusta]
MPAGIIPIMYIELAFTVLLFVLGILLLIGINYVCIEMIYVIPESIVVAIYWILNFFLLAAALICVVSYWQELLDDLYGKERRVKYFHKMANIRSAALSGNNTPYRSGFGSKSSLMLSQGSINPAFQHLLTLKYKSSSPRIVVKLLSKAAFNILESLKTDLLTTFENFSLTSCDLRARMFNLHNFMFSGALLSDNFEEDLIENFNIRQKFSLQ